MSDELIRLLSIKAQKDCPIRLRRITFKRSEDQQQRVFISNDLKRSAVEIAALYKQRWQIERFFKWIKQKLKIKRFIGRSENAVIIQTLIAVIAPAITPYSIGRIQHLIVTKNSPISQRQPDQSQIDISVVKSFIKQTTNPV